MKVYIASKYMIHKEINRTIYHVLSSHGFDVFLPETINIEGGTRENMERVAQKCYSEIDSSDILLVVSPFGHSVSAEIGYAINDKLRGKDIKIIVYYYTAEGKEKEGREEMIVSFFDDVVDATEAGEEAALQQLVKVLGKYGSYV